MNIGELATKAGVPAKTIRYYEESGLIPPAKRDTNGYRAFRDSDIHKLAFLGRSRALGLRLRTAATCLHFGRTKTAPAVTCVPLPKSTSARSRPKSQTCKPCAIRCLILSAIAQVTDGPIARSSKRLRRCPRQNPNKITVAVMQYLMVA